MRREEEEEEEGRGFRAGWELELSLGDAEGICTMSPRSSLRTVCFSNQSGCRYRLLGI